MKYTCVYILLIVSITSENAMALDFGSPGIMETGATLGSYAHQISYFHQSNNTDSKENNYFISPYLGYFILPKLSIGLSIYYSNTEITLHSENSLSSTTIGYFLHVQDHWKVYNNFLLFIGGIYGTTIRNEPANIAATLFTSNFLGDTLGIEAGIKYFFRDIIITFGPTWLFSQMYHEKEREKDFYSRYSIFNIGAGYLL